MHHMGERRFPIFNLPPFPTMFARIFPFISVYQERSERYCILTLADERHR